MEEQNGRATREPKREDVCPSQKGKLSLDDLRAEINEANETKSGPEYWRSLEELAGSPAFQEALHREFPKARWVEAGAPDEIGQAEQIAAINTPETTDSSQPGIGKPRRPRKFVASVAAAAISAIISTMPAASARWWSFNAIGRRRGAPSSRDSTRSTTPVAPAPAHTMVTTAIASSSGELR